jgi:hypothetical protein
MCFADLDQGSKMNIFESILTTFIANLNFRGTWAVAKIGSSLKLNYHKQIWLA